MTDTIEQAARVIAEAAGLGVLGLSNDATMTAASAIAQALSDAGLLAGGERETVYEVYHDDGDFCASADTLSDAQHYAAVYGQDAPTHIIVATTYRQPLPSPPEEGR